ncbi:nuclear transport factor 2 family protein [Geojedonia litorea]|uniref:Nuclear transport factor 2 family protein n=1 Tax=Geojedonia litorea TaxID=1268269 RepID=A0ABV9MYH1_9FLAO
MKPTKLSHSAFFALLVLFSLLSCKHEIVDQSSAEQELRQMEKLQIRGILEQDSTIIRKLLANDLIVNAPTNTVFDLNVVMDAFKQGYINYSSYEQKIDEIKIIENIGIVMGLEIVTPTGLTGNVGNTEKRRFTDIWMYKNNQWQMIARQATNIL